MYLCNVCMYVCMYVCVYMYVCMYVCMCIYVCMYVCNVYMVVTTFALASIFHIPNTGCLDSCISRLTIPETKIVFRTYLVIQILTTVASYCMFVFSLTIGTMHKLSRNRLYKV